MKILYIILILAMCGLYSVQAGNSNKDLFFQYMEESAGGNNQSAYSSDSGISFETISAFSDSYSDTQSRSGIGVLNLEMPDGPGTIVNPDNEYEVPVSSSFFLLCILSFLYAYYLVVRFRKKTF